MAKNEKQSWEKDFTEFVAAEPIDVPSSVSESVLGQIGEELHPSSFAVLGKISFIQFAVGLVTLLFCPQFGISFTSNMGLMPYLMKFGESVCMLGCGAVFTGFSLFVASLALRPEEVRVFKQNEVIQLVTISSLSVGAFLCVGGEVVAALGLIWMLGALVGGALSLEAGWALRKSLLRKAIL